MFESTVISTEVEPILLDLPGVSVRVLHRGNAESGQVVIKGWPPVRSSLSTAPVQ